MCDVMWRCCGGGVIVVVVVEVVLLLLWRWCCGGGAVVVGHLCKYFIVLDTQGRDIKKLSQQTHCSIVF